ncbi:MAG: WecB/TagA/CpsF family glycosyltransferase [Candidatus Berkelbacteria bacterium]|nr:MAG: WecB/TagA/CpsF family glycosyltransferase [Candidatus Berkelbacteria bacterium]QQG51389.1 MAG: WecB/TagA/CpsF family glycosyltransferase [Candidatus Berkelbacteria bacterium]
MWQPDFVQILGVRVDNMTWKAVDSFALKALSGNEPNQIVTVNGEHILAASNNGRHRDVINNADVVVPDATNVVLVSRLKGRGLHQTIPGVDLVLWLAKTAAETNHTVFLLGGGTDIAKVAASKLQSIFPGLKISGTSSADPDELEVIKEIRDASSDIVFVAYGAPKQEYWIAEHKAATGAKILVGVGGTFDMLSGVLPRAPKLMRSLHLEWLWRLIIQPSRIGRIWNAVIVFPFKALTTK